MIKRLSADQMVAQLDHLDVPFFMPGHQVREVVEPTALLVGLAASPEARMRLALIPLLIRRPGFADCVRMAETHLDEDGRIVLRCYYTAAMLLQRKHQLADMADAAEQNPLLPDLYSDVLSLPADVPIDTKLQLLGQRQAELSGQPINWTGTYEHGIRYL